jgi:hypothetical protein
MRAVLRLLFRRMLRRLASAHSRGFVMTVFIPVSSKEHSLASWNKRLNFMYSAFFFCMDRWLAIRRSQRFFVSMHKLLVDSVADSLAAALLHVFSPLALPR